MASDQTVQEYYSKALWDPTPTNKSDLRARQLAVALGYPPSWRVVRRLVGNNNHNTNNTNNSNNTNNGIIIVDRIYAGKPSTGCDMWFNHEAALQAAEKWTDESTPFDCKGGHMLPRVPLYQKGDKVQVKYEGSWWDATIMRRKDHLEGFRYQVHYPTDNSKQSGVEEALIRDRPEAPDPKKTALKLGFGEGWEAYSTGHNRWKVVAPDGEIFSSKKKALEAYQLALTQRDSPATGDPPWRTTGSDYLGRRVLWTTKHKASARRTVQLEQIGSITGWISETDVDKAGEPGFVSEKTGQPAKLFHVDFDDDSHHPYASMLVSSQDLEEFEILECLIDEDTAFPPKKKAKKR